MSNLYRQKISGCQWEVTANGYKGFLGVNENILELDSRDTQPCEYIKTTQLYTLTG